MEFKRVTASSELHDLLLTLLTHPIALDIETTGLDERECSIISLILANATTAWEIPVEFVSDLKCLTTAPLLILQNFKFDFKVLSRYGINLIDTSFIDIMLLHHLIDENAEHSLDSMVSHYYNDNYKQTFWSKYKEYSEATPLDALEYACKDGIYTYRLWEMFVPQIDPSLVKHVHELAKALYHTEVRGVRVDKALIDATEVTMSAQINEYLPKLRAVFSIDCDLWEFQQWAKEREKRVTEKGKERVKRPQFNFSSDSQVKWLLYDSLNLPILKRTKKTPKGGGGNPAVDYETIELLEKNEPRLSTLKDYKGIKSHYATFVVGVGERVVNGSIYPTFNVNGTVTGRISHSNPNMGNMPTDGVYRNFFLPDEGDVIFGADYTQLEVVVEANLTGDANLAKICNEGVSKHDITNDELKLKDRGLAKTLNFAMQYWCSPWKVAQLLKCSKSEAAYIWNKYWEVYSGPKKLKDYTDAHVDYGKPLRNCFGRLKHFSTSYEKPWHKDGAKREAYNFMIQGPGSDAMNASFYMAATRMRKSGVGRMLWTVHDEGIGSCNPKNVEEEKHLLVADMCSLTSYLHFKIPLTAKAYGPFDRWCKT